MRLVAAVCLALLLAACVPGGPASLAREAHPTTLGGTAWRLISVGDRVAGPGPDVVVEFGDRSHVDGEAPCNQLSGGYAYDPATGAIRIADLVTTKRACTDPARAALESAFLAALRGASVVDVDPAGRLRVRGAGPELVLEVTGRPGPSVIGDSAPS